MLGIRYGFFRIMPADWEKRAWETLLYLPGYEKIGWASGARMQYLALGITFARIRSADSFPKRGSFPSIESLVWVSQGQDAASSITCYFFRIRSADSLMRYRGDIPLQHDSRD
jgi:hypothetical protein